MCPQKTLKEQQAEWRKRLEAFQRKKEIDGELLEMLSVSLATRASLIEDCERTIAAIENIDRILIGEFERRFKMTHDQAESLLAHLAETDQSPTNGHP